MPYTYEHPHPAITVDCVVFGFAGESLEVLLIERDREPFSGQWALPGGYMEIGETLEDAARRELEEETGLANVFLEQLYSFGDVERDPRERVVTVAYFALVRPSDHTVKAATDARSAGWFPVKKLPKLAFDHNKIVKKALERLKGKVRYQPVGFELLPPKFTLTQLQRLYEVILESPLDKRNFRKKLLSLGILKELDEVQKGVSHRAARLYRFDKKNYQRLIRDGFYLEILTYPRVRRNNLE